VATPPSVLEQTGERRCQRPGTSDAAAATQLDATPQEERMFEDFGDSLRLAFQDGLSDLFAFLPRMFGALLLLLVGWFLGKLVGSLVSKALRAVQFNTIADKAEIDTFLRNAGVRMGPAAVVGAMARWFIYLVFFLTAFDALGLTQVSAVIDDVLAFLPKVVVAIVVLLVGALAGTLLGGVVRGAVTSAGLQNAGLYATVARFAVIAFAAIAALDMLGIAPNVVATLWTGVVTLVVGTLVLAFGLGGREAASNLWMGRLLRAELEPEVEIQAGSYTGRVRTIGSLFTTLETAQGVVKVPNAMLTGQHVQLSQHAFDQQVQKRQQLKEQARQALERSQKQNGQQQGNGQRRPVSPSTTVVTPTSTRAPLPRDPASH
jgi:hypothetical protein